MERKMIKVEKLADWKRTMKTFVRGVIKGKVFADEAGKVNFVVEKEAEDGANYVTMGAYGATGCYAEFAVEVSTRVFNKVVPELFGKTIEQFNKLKGFAGMSVEVR